jgi:hypothetical protein
MRAISMTERTDHAQSRRRAPLYWPWVLAALAGVMVVEKTIPSGRWLSPVVEIALVLLAAVWLIHPAWLA